MGGVCHGLAFVAFASLGAADAHRADHDARHARRRGAAAGGHGSTGGGRPVPLPARSGHRHRGEAKGDLAGEARPPPAHVRRRGPLGAGARPMPGASSRRTTPRWRRATRPTPPASTRTRWQAYEAAAKEKPESSELQFNRGNALFKLGRQRRGEAGVRAGARYVDRREPQGPRLLQPGQHPGGDAPGGRGHPGLPPRAGRRSAGRRSPPQPRGHAAAEDEAASALAVQGRRAAPPMEVRSPKPKDGGGEDGGVRTPGLPKGPAAAPMAAVAGEMAPTAARLMVVKRMAALPMDGNRGDGGADAAVSPQPSPARWRPALRRWRRREARPSLTRMSWQSKQPDGGAGGRSRSTSRTPSAFSTTMRRNEKPNPLCKFAEQASAGAGPPRQTVVGVRPFAGMPMRRPRTPWLSSTLATALAC